MGIYIAGMDYPEMLSQTITIMRDGRVYSYPSGQKIGKAVEVKKHGRLIDADAIDTTYSDPEVVETLESAPTVIDAEE